MEGSDAVELKQDLRAHTSNNKTTKKIKLTKWAVSSQTKENGACNFKELGILV